MSKTRRGRPVMPRRQRRLPARRMIDLPSEVEEDEIEIGGGSEEREQPSSP